MKRVPGFIAAALILGCASKYEVPKQTFEGHFSVAPEALPPRVHFIETKPTIKNPKIVLFYPGTDQIPNYRFPTIQLEIADFLSQLKQTLMKSRQFGSVEIVSETLWSGKTLNDIRRVGALYDAPYVVILNLTYDFRSFYSTMGHFVGWLPYINFVVPIYKLEGEAKGDIAILNTVSGSLIYQDVTVVAQKERGSSLFIEDHFAELSRRAHLVLRLQIEKKLLGWFNG